MPLSTTTMRRGLVLLGRRRLSATAAPPIRRKDSEFHHLPSSASSMQQRQQRLAQHLQHRQLDTASRTLPWFLSNMPDWYFASVPEELQQHHLSALAGIHEAGMVPELALQFGPSTVTLVHPKNQPGGLDGLLRTLRKYNAAAQGGGELESTHTFVAKDGSLSLNVFRFAASPAATGAAAAAVPAELEQYVRRLKQGEFDAAAQSKTHPHVSKHSPVLSNLPALLASHPADHVLKLSPRRFLLQMDLVREVEGTDGVCANVELDYAGVKGDAMITLAATEVKPIAALSRVARFLGALGVDIARTQIETIRGVSVLKVLTTSYVQQQNKTTTTWEITGSKHLEDLTRVVKWVDDRVLDVFELPAFNHSLVFAESCVALCDLTHALMSPSDPYQYARSRVQHLLTKNQHSAEGEIGRELVLHFLRKFSPRYQQPASSAYYDYSEMRAKINAKIENPSSRAVLEKLQDCIEGVMRTNLHLDKHRFALAMRLDPTKCHPPQEMMQDREVPFGLFFASGRRFTGFQLRFSDIARGGLRLVSPANAELFSMETSRQYFECFDLAFAQQLKNKDIAEGGAKAVCVIEAWPLDAPEDRSNAMRRTAKAFVDSVLDLLPPNHPESDELVYFGPDENIVPQDIAWIAKRAVERKYPLGNVVISSKANAGINHKRYGVTSEGVNVFMETALREMGVDPKRQPFTVKITGFGDVGGNLLKILHRDYGQQCRVVGISDATGCAEDPEGLRWPELLRLFHGNLALHHMDAKQGLTSAQGRLGLATDQDGLLLRNTMHFRVRSDVFLPAGGRPAAINAHNWKQFLVPGSATPSSRIIVEGANLFLTAPARKLLSLEAGCLIVKDSSANKCGVITSSYEVLGGMILSEEQFMQVKEEYVEAVLGRLRYLAQLEADMLMREWRRAGPHKIVLPETCIALSHAMLRLADKLEVWQQGQPSTDEDLLRFVAALLPMQPLLKALGNDAPTEEDVLQVLRERLPAAYLRSLISKVVASECVYREGTDFFATAQSAVDYIRAVRTVDDLSKELDRAHQPRAAQLLRLSGARTLVGMAKGGGD